MLCKCNCGKTVSNFYRPGHDARHAGQVARQMVQAWSQGNTGDSFLKQLPSVALQVKATDLAERWMGKGTPKTKKCATCDNRADSTDNPEICQTCYTLAEYENGHLDGDHRPGEEPENCPECRDLTVHVGRWSYTLDKAWYDVYLDSDDVRVRYRDRKDKSQTARVSPDKIQG